MGEASRRPGSVSQAPDARGRGGVNPEPPRRSRTLDAMLDAMLQEDAAAAAAAAAAVAAAAAAKVKVKAEEIALARSAVGAGPPPAVFGKRKHSEVQGEVTHSEAAGEGARRCESKGGASKAGAAEGAAGGGAASGGARPAKQPKLRGTALVNRRVRVWWGGDRKWFAGVVASYSSRRGHQVQ